MRLFLQLRRSGQILCIALLGCSGILGGMLMWEYRQQAVSASTTAHDLLRFIQVVKAFDMISAERGPTNAIVAAQGARPDLARSLAEARQRSDAGLAHVAEDPALAEAVAAIRDRLETARSTVNAIVARSPDQRTIADVDTAVAVMVSVIDRSEPLVEESTRAVTSQSTPAITGYAILIRALSDMRDYAGRMGSALMVPLALGRPITVEQRAVYDSDEGRVRELYRLIRGTIRTGSDEAIRRSLTDVEMQFLGGGMTVFREILDAGRSGTYPMDREAFTANLQPGFRTLSTLRDAVADRAWRTLEVDGQRANRAFLVVATITSLMMGLEVILILAAQQLIFHPLLDARRAILGLAAGRVDDLPERPAAIGEMGELFGALALLKEQIRDRNVLDRENRRLAEQLRDLADRDGLTGVLNRGALERIVTSLFDEQAGPRTLGLIMIDIDHFKTINDGFGHRGGDYVLRVLSNRWREALPSEAIFARFGGEEFAVVMVDTDLSQLRSLAEQLRQAAALDVHLPSGLRVPVSASLGVAVVPQRDNSWVHLVETADAALYRAKRTGRNAVKCDGDAPQASDIATAA